MRNQDKICSDCKHYRRNGTFHNCTAVRSLITGELSEMSATVVRGDKKLCGPDGRMFEDKIVKSKTGKVSEKA